MATKRIIKKRYPGVIARTVNKKTGTGKELQFYVAFKKGGRRIEKKIGRESDGIGWDSALSKKLAMKEGKIQNGKAEMLTYGQLWEHYRKNARRPDGSPIKGWKEYESLNRKWLAPEFKSKLPEDIVKLDVDRLRKKIKGLSVQRQRHIQSLLIRVINYGIERELTKGLQFKIKLPRVQNEKTEHLTKQQQRKLYKAIAADNHQHAGYMMLLALHQGLRRGEMFRLRWSDIDFKNGLLFLRDTKSGEDKILPLSQRARSIFKCMLRNYRRLEIKKDGTALHNNFDYLLKRYSQIEPHVFFGRLGERVNVDKATRKIRDAAGLSKDFRPLHGLRHQFASNLAAKGASAFEIMNALTQSEVKMAERYVHVDIERLRTVIDGKGRTIAS